MISGAFRNIAGDAVLRHARIDSLASRWGAERSALGAGAGNLRKAA